MAARGSTGPRPVALGTADVRDFAASSLELLLLLGPYRSAGEVEKEALRLAMVGVAWMEESRGAQRRGPRRRMELPWARWRLVAAMVLSFIDGAMVGVVVGAPGALAAPQGGCAVVVSSPYKSAGDGVRVTSRRKKREEFAPALIESPYRGGRGMDGGRGGSVGEEVYKTKRKEKKRQNGIVRMKDSRPRATTPRITRRNSGASRCRDCGAPNDAISVRNGHR